MTRPPKLPEWWITSPQRRPQYTNRVSGIGHPCVFYNYLSRARWDDRDPPGEILRRVFEIGYMWEHFFMRKLFDGGCEYKVISYQRDVAWPDLQLTGHLDVVVEYMGESIMLDFKSASPNAYRIINSLDDLRRSPYHYHNSYVTQASLYGSHPDVNTDWCGLLLTNKVSGEWKEILWAPNEAEQEVDTAMSACEKINDAIAKNPPLADAQEELATPGSQCRQCGFRHICTAHWAAHETAEYQVLADKKLNELLDKRLKLVNKISPYDGELKEIETELREHFIAAGKGKYDFGKTKVRVGYTPEKEVPAKEAHTRAGYWRIGYTDEE